MSTGIRFSGLGTGIDTDAIVTALMRLERIPITRIEDDKKKITERKGVVQEINKLLETLREKAAALLTPAALGAKTAISADPAVVTASATAGAAAGAYNVDVTSLARAHTTASAAAPALTAGQSLDITVGGAGVSVSVQGGDTLQTFAERINATDDVGVSASVVNDRLVLISRTSGSAGTITLGGDAAAALGFTTTQAGQDAVATVNGLTVTSAGNTIKGAINGVDLTLAKVGSTTVTVGHDIAANQKQVGDFVDAYNALIKNVNSATRYDAVSQTAGTLQGDQTISSLGGQLRGIAGAAVSGLSGAYDSLAQIGVTSSRDGTLTLDAAALATALEADPDAVRAVFARDGGGGAADGIARQVEAFAESFSRDVLTTRITGLNGSITRADDKIKSLEALMDLKETRMRAQFAAMEKAVYQFQSQAADIAARLGTL